MIIQAAHFSQIDPDAWPGEFFTPEETADNITGRVYCDRGFLLFMDDLRHAVGKPLIINSWFREPERNKGLKKAVEGSAHTMGCGADIKASLDLAFEIQHHAQRLGCRRIGFCQHGDHDSRFVHLDLSKRHPNPRIWTYK